MKIVSRTFVFFAVLIVFGCASSLPEDSEAVYLPLPAEEAAPVPEPAAEEPPPQSEQEPVSTEDEAGHSEYIEAVGELTEARVTESQYNADKAEIMNIISKLDDIMKRRDYSGWLQYISPASREYWSDPRNLRQAASRLPVQGLALNSLKDYFLYIFIPSRQGRNIDRIKYISPVLVKAVQTSNDRDIIFYHFEKLGNEWKIRLDRLEN